MVVIYSDSYGELHVRNKFMETTIIGIKKGEIFCGIR